MKDNLGNAALGALVTTAHGEIAGKIKVNLSEDYIAHKIAHAVAGCAAAAAANQGKCRDGAIGAAVGEMVGEAMLGGRDVNTLSAKERQKIIGYSQIIAGSTVALVKGDVNTAANAAAVAVESNALSNPEIIEIGKRVDKECNQGNNVECRNKIIAEAVNKSDQRSRLTKQDIADITAVQNKYAAEAFSICKGNSACATFVGNKFTYARLHCESSGCMVNIAQSIIRETSSRYGSVWDTASRVFEDFSPIFIAGVKPPLKLNSNSNINNIIYLNKNYKHITYQGRETITDGKYIVDPIGMARHKPGTVESKSFINKSLFKSDIDAERAALDAARYADKYNLWRQNKAKVPTLDIVGYSNGKPTKIINVYRKDNGAIHATPGN